MIGSMSNSALVSNPVLRGRISGTLTLTRQSNSILAFDITMQSLDPFTCASTVVSAGPEISTGESGEISTGGNGEQYSTGIDRSRFPRVVPCQGTPYRSCSFPGGSTTVDLSFPATRSRSSGSTA
jgi:hypothetical protein